MRLHRASAPRSSPLETAGPTSRARATIPVAKLGAGDAPAALAAPPVPSPPAVLTGPGHGGAGPRAGASPTPSTQGQRQEQASRLLRCHLAVRAARTLGCPVHVL